MALKNIYTPVNLGDTSNEFTDIINSNFATTKNDIKYLQDNIGGVTTTPATETTLGGIKASPKTANETVEVKIGSDAKLYVPKGEGITEIFPATQTIVGGIKASPRTANETTEVKIGSDAKLYVPEGIKVIPQATEIALGGIRARPRGVNDNSEIKIDTVTGRLYTMQGVLTDNVIEDNTSTNISHTFPNNTSVTYRAYNITKVDLIFSEEIYNGFFSSVTIMSGINPPDITFSNKGTYQLRLLFRGIELGRYVPNPSRVVSMAVFCDGVYVYCHIREV